MPRMILRYTGSLAVLFALLSTVALAADSPLGSWQADSNLQADTGIRLLDGADGQIAWMTRKGSKGVTTMASSNPPSAFIYFAFSRENAVDPARPLYLTVEYFDASAGNNPALVYDSSQGDGLQAFYKPAEALWGGWSNGGKVWRKAVFELRFPAFRHRENLGADFRISGSGLLLRAVSLSLQKPANTDSLTHKPVMHRIPEARIGADRRMIIGGFDPVSLESSRETVQSLTATLPILKSIGATSHEVYIRWNLCEPSPGVYDWSVYDPYVALYKECGMKWTPFLIFGSAYSLPDWFYKKEGFQGYRCLEHGEESDVASLWNPVLREHLARFIEAFFTHYRDSGVIESVLLGITGNYGEAIYVASGNDWTADAHGAYHTHSGLWAGDPLAMADFRRWLQAKYGDSAALGAAWGIAAPDMTTIQPFTREAAPSDRAWLDFCQWYIGSMNDYCRFWLENIRKNWDGPVEICTGGHAPAEHGADFGMQCKIAAEYGGGVRITNEGSSYRDNFSLTRWVASAGRQYGATFSFEPAGGVDPHGVIARIYNAATSGALGLHYYYPNIFAETAARKNWIRWASEWRSRTPRTEIAVYYPETHILLHGNKFLEQAQPLRDRFDFAYESDQQILDGGLDTVKALVLLWGNTSEKEVWAAIQEWVRRGGLLLYTDALGRLHTVEGDESCHDSLFGEGADIGKGRIARFTGGAERDAYYHFLTEVLATAPELSRATRTMVKEDGKEDQVFATVIGANRLLWLNYTDHPVTRSGKQLPPWAIKEASLR